MPTFRPQAEALESRTLFAVTPFNIQRVMGPVQSAAATWELTEMNDSGAMVGLHGFSTAYRYSPSSGLTTLLNGAWSVSDINSAGVAVGSASNARFVQGAGGNHTAWTGNTSTTAMIDFAGQSTSDPFLITNGHAIGDDGTVYGSYFGPDSANNEVAAYFKDGQKTLITIDGTRPINSRILDVNADGMYVGVFRTATGADAIFRGMGVAAQSLLNVPLASGHLEINDAGDVLYTLQSLGSRVYLAASGTSRSFGHVNAPAGGSDGVKDLNSNGWYVGQSIAGAAGNVATLWTADETLDLNSLIPQNSGWRLVEAEVINDRNQIAGWGYYQGQHATFLLTPNNLPLPPVPAPGSGGGNGVGSSPSDGTRDLVARFGVIDHMTLVPGQKLTLPVQMQNVGTGFVGASSVGVYASTDGDYDAADVLLSAVPTAGLGSGYSRNVRAQLKVPASLPRGTYRLIVVADIYNQVAETSEVNNSAASVNTTGNAVFADVKWAIGNVGGRIVRKLTVTNDLGLPVTFNLAGPGTAEIDSVGGIFSLTATGTTGATNLTVTSFAGATLGNVTIDGSLRGFKASGNINLSGGTFDVQTIRSFVAPGFGSDIVIRGAGVATAFNIGWLSDVNLTTASHITRLVTGDANLVTITAPSAGAITGRGSVDLAMTLAGNLRALNVAGILTPDLSIAGSVGRIVAGAVRGGTGIIVTGPSLGIFSLRNLADGLAAFDSQLTASAIGTITLPSVGTFSDVFIHATFVRSYTRRDGGVRLLNVSTPGVQDHSGTYDLTIL
jgi:hypothetical protein